ncbi:MAG: D-isomer specific 2-hydroxyacid dehydrogenase family protein [Anaerococcus sp.]|nr:D-isomer specific 2-hydroxyacid dehydrogenase family protein [Anaerococcus sp.]
MKIAIVNSSSFGKIFPEHIKKLEKIGQVDRFEVDQNIDGKTLGQMLKDYQYIIASVTPCFDKDFFENVSDLRLISRHGIGYNNIDLLSAKEKGVVVSIVPSLVERDSVAENNITNLLALMRMTINSCEEVKNDKWENRAKFVGNSIYHKTVGVIGVGNTGSQVARTLREGFQCKVLGYDPYKDKLELDQFGVEKVDFETLLENSDAICLCANLTKENYHMINKNTISKMKDGVYISNTARGALINQKDMIEALKNKKVKALATDVLEVEPARDNHPFLKFDNVILTPHTSAYTKECLYAMGENCVNDVYNVHNKRLPKRCVQKESPFVE